MAGWLYTLLGILPVSLWEKQKPFLKPPATFYKNLKGHPNGKSAKRHSRYNSR